MRAKVRLMVILSMLVLVLVTGNPAAATAPKKTSADLDPMASQGKLMPQVTYSRPDHNIANLSYYSVQKIV